MKNFISIILVLFSILNCEKKSITKNYNPIESFNLSKNSKKLGDTLIISAKFPTIIKEIPAKEKFINNFTKEDLLKEKDWIEVKKDENGFLIYQGCDQNPFEVIFKKDSAEIHFWPETMTSKIKNFSKANLYNHFFDFQYYDYFTNKFENVNVESYGSENLIYKWKLRGWTFLMTPKKNEKFFRKIINECYEKTGELKFEEIN